PNIRRLPLVNAHRVVTHAWHLLENSVRFAFQIMIKPGVREFVVIQASVADTPLTDYCVFSRTLVRAMKCRCDDRILLISNFRRRSFSYVIVGGEIWANRHVVPGHKPESRNVDSHVVVPQSAFVPGWIVRVALDHRPTCVDRHSIRVDSLWSTRGFHYVFDWQVLLSLRPIARWALSRNGASVRRLSALLP